MIKEGIKIHSYERYKTKMIVIALMIFVLTENVGLFETHIYLQIVYMLYQRVLIDAKLFADQKLVKIDKVMVVVQFIILVITGQNYQYMFKNLDSLMMIAPKIGYMIVIVYIVQYIEIIGIIKIQREMYNYYILYQIIKFKIYFYYIKIKN